MDKPNSKNNSRKLVTANIRVRVVRVTAVILLAFVVLVGRLAYLSVIRHDYYSQRATSQQLRDTVIAAQRGTIYDRNGEVLASSMLDASAKHLTPPAVTAPEGKEFVGWFTETTDADGNMTLSLVFAPTESGTISLADSYVLEPMVLQARFDTPKGE